MDEGRVASQNVTENIRPTVCAESPHSLRTINVPSKISLCITRLPLQNKEDLFKNSRCYEPSFTLSKRSPKVYVDLGNSLRTWVRRLAVLDTGSGPNFVRVDVLPSNYEYTLEPTVLPSASDGNDQPPRLVGQVSLHARLGMRQAKLRLPACQRLAAPTIL